MQTKWTIAMLLASTMLTVGTSAEQAPKAQPTQAEAPAPMKHTGEWRASKLIGLNVYNQQNEKIGDINEILLDQAGKVTGVVVGVGGFLGVGEHDILVKMDQIKFVNEPVRSATNTTKPAPPNTTGSGATTTTRPVRTANEKWVPDHAVMNATKDQLKAMPQFEYGNSN